MKRVLILYDTQFGNTRKLAIEIASGIQKTDGITTKVADGNSMETEDLSKYDAVLFGGPTRAFRATHGALSTIKKAAKIGLDGKIVSTFGTYMLGNQSRGVKAMDKLLRKVAPGALIISPGFSGKVDGPRGPLNETVVPDSHRFATVVVEKLTQESSQTIQRTSN